MIRLGVQPDQFRRLYDEAKEHQFRQAPATDRRDNPDRLAMDIVNQFMLNCATFVNMQTQPASNRSTAPRRETSASSSSGRRVKRNLKGGGSFEITTTTSSTSVPTLASRLSVSAAPSAVNNNSGVSATSLSLVQRRTVKSPEDLRRVVDLAKQFGLSDELCRSSRLYQRWKPQAVA